MYQSISVVYIQVERVMTMSKEKEGTVVIEYQLRLENKANKNKV